MSVKSTFLIKLLILSFSLSAPSKAIANDAWGKYCIYTYFSGTVCKATLEEMFSAYNLDISAGDDEKHIIWEPTGKLGWSPEPGKVKVEY